MNSSCPSSNFATFFALSILSFLACQQDEDDSGSNDSPPITATGTSTTTNTTDFTQTGDASVTGSSSTESDDTGTGDSGMSPCEIQATALQTVLDNALATESNLAGGVSLSAITPMCGQWSGTTGQSRVNEVLSQDHFVRMGSVSKTYVAAAILKLVSEGTIRLEDTIQIYAPSLPNADRITIRNLLNHTSGIYNYTEDMVFLAKYVGFPEISATPEEIVEVAISNGPAFEPDTDWGYSNTNYILLGLILAQHEGTSAALSIRNRTLTPAQLQETYLDGEEPAIGTLAGGWSTFLNQQIDVTTIIHPSIAWTAGSMVATVRDTARWGHALFGGTTILSVSEKTEMLRTVETSEADLSYGLGVIVLDFGPGGKAYGHNGGIPGYSTIMFYFEAIDSTLALVVNHDLRESTLNLAFEEATDVLFGAKHRFTNHFPPDFMYKF